MRCGLKNSVTSLASCGFVRRTGNFVGFVMLRLIFSLLICISQTLKMSRLMTKPTNWHVHPAKTQISPGIHPVWSVFAVCIKKAWVLPVQRTAKTDQTGRMPRLIRVFTGHIVILLVLLWGSSNSFNHELLHFLISVRVGNSPNWRLVPRRWSVTVTGTIIHGTGPEMRQLYLKVGNTLHPPVLARACCNSFQFCKVAIISWLFQLSPLS